MCKMCQMRLERVSAQRSGSRPRARRPASHNHMYTAQSDTHTLCTPEPHTAQHHTPLSTSRAVSGGHRIVISISRSTCLLAESRPGARGLAPRVALNPSAPATQSASLQLLTAPSASSHRRQGAPRRGRDLRGPCECERARERASARLTGPLAAAALCDAALVSGSPAHTAGLRCR